MVHQQSFTLNTNGHRDMLDLTKRVQEIVSKAGIRTGIVQVFHLGSTAAVGIIEFEPHLQATLLGQGLTVPVKDGKLWLGTWQQIFLLDCDIHARERTVAVTVVGE
jgi:thiamine phosphate synthase YjbQ (UPF0047 family)